MCTHSVSDPSHDPFSPFLMSGFLPETATPGNKKKANKKTDRCTYTWPPVVAKKKAAADKNPYLRWTKTQTNDGQNHTDGQKPKLMGEKKHTDGQKPTQTKHIHIPTVAGRSVLRSPVDARQKLECPTNKA